MIIDDVISAGTSVRESVDIIRAQGAEPAGVVIALDRQERGRGERSAVQEVQEEIGIPVAAIVRLEHLIEYLSKQPDASAHLTRIEEYSALYGV